MNKETKVEPLATDDTSEHEKEVLVSVLSEALEVLRFYNDYLRYSLSTPMKDRAKDVERNISRILNLADTRQLETVVVPPPATDARVKEQPQRPNPDPRVEKALRDYDEGNALDSLTTNAEAYENGTITLASHAANQQEWHPCCNGTSISTGTGIIYVGKSEVTKLLCDAHNAAIKAAYERGRNEQTH